MNINRCLVKIKGVNIDETLTKIYKQNTEISNIKRKSHTELEFVVSNNDYNKIKKLLKNFEVNIIFLGFKKLKRFFISTLAVWLAIPVSIIMAIVSSKCLWKIEINGLVDIKKSEIVRVLKENGIQQGGKKLLSVKEIETILLSNAQIAQVSCYYRGTTLMINVSEKLVYEPKEYAPIVAKFNAIINDYNLIRGTINFVVGEFVKAGDILVFPYLIDKNNNKVPVNPEATISGDVFSSATKTLNAVETILVRSGKTKTKYNICYKFGKENIVNLLKPFVFCEAKVYNNYISDVLPFVRQKIVYYELITNTKNNDLIANKAIIEQESKSMALKNVVNTETIFNLKTQSVIVDNILYSTTTITYIGSVI